MKIVIKEKLKKAIENALEETGTKKSIEFYSSCQWYYEALTDSKISKKYIKYFMSNNLLGV